ncbi:ROK family protein [Clostridium vincentii]|uniref:N-acetylmannosamine kinase n=1 Tax=Clostridium vincentii TaxID=52704 RepID=A0A2T0BJS0_9CLOT|nr:ROK family protein [Clostridium vincentii]PRR84052.1 N-acetylmannosamine kinase [Clostridium vincentii]
MGNVIGIDIGGTNLRAAILDEKHNLITKFKMDNEVAMGPEYNLGKLIAKIDNEWNDFKVKAIGIGCPGPLDIRNGIIINPPNLKGWEGFEIKKYFEKHFKLPVAVNNDANVAAYSEAKVGSAAGAESVYYITLSTGVGGGFIYKDEIISGFNSIAAEVCNMIINEDDYSHSGLNKGGLEGQCSGIAIARVASEKLGVAVSTKYVFEEAERGNKFCQYILNNWTINVAKAIANIIVTVDPEVIVLGGSVILNNRSYLSKIIEEVKLRVFEGANIQIKIAEIGEDTGLIGAGLLAASL